MYKDIVQALCKILEKNGVLRHFDAVSLEKAFKDRSDITFEDFLLEEGITTKPELLIALGEFYEVPALDIEGELLEHQLVVMFPKDEMLRNFFIPYLRDGDVLQVVASNPNNATLSEIIGRYVSYDVTYMVGIARDISDMVEEYYDASITERELDVFEPAEEEEKKQDFDDIVDEEGGI